MGWLDGKAALARRRRLRDRPGGGRRLPRRGRARRRARARPGQVRAAAREPRAGSARRSRATPPRPPTTSAAVTRDARRVRRPRRARHFVGVFDYYTRLEAIPDESARRRVRRGVRGQREEPCCPAKAALEPLTAAGGSIVLTVSTLRLLPGPRRRPLRGLEVRRPRARRRSSPTSWRPRVRVNGVAPGGTLGTDWPGAVSLGLGDAPPRRRAGPRRAAPRARRRSSVALRPEDHAGAYVFLGLRPCPRHHRHDRQLRRRDRGAGLRAQRARGASRSGSSRPSSAGSAVTEKAREAGRSRHATSPWREPIRYRRDPAPRAQP